MQIDPYEHLQVLAEDEAFGEAKGSVERYEILRKRAHQRAFVNAEGTVAERNAEATISDDVEALDDAYIAALIRYETLKAKRQHAELCIEVWRTVESSRRKGNV